MQICPMGSGILQLESEEDGNFGIFVAVSSESSNKEYICLFDASKDLNAVNTSEADFNSMQRLYRLYYGIKIAQLGKYATACGKGFWDCRTDEPEEIEFKYPGIQFFMDEAGYRVFYYWDVDKKMFKEIQVGD